MSMDKRIFKSMKQVMRAYWPERTALEDERQELIAKGKLSLLELSRLIEIERRLDPWK